MILKNILSASRLLVLKSSIHFQLISKKHTTVWGYKKIQRYKPLYVSKIMAEIDPKIAEILAPLRQSVKEQGDIVRNLKSTGAPELDITRAVAELKNRKRILEEKELELAPPDAGFDRAKMEDLIKRRFFFDQSFSIYGGITGQYDFGPMGCSIKNSIINLWRTHFVLAEQMMEVECSILTPEPVLKASGHVERFADLMVKDLGNGDCFRLDHLIKAHLEKLIADKKTSETVREESKDIIIKLDGFSKDEMNSILRKYNIKSPVTGNEVSDAIEFNLMFATSIGPSGAIKGFLRPETAQGIFVNFKRLLEFNQRKIPFAVAQVGNAFRNEISPRSGLIRVREFTMAEIEHFVDPTDKSHPKFSNVSHLVLNLYTACNQMDGKPSEQVKLKDAVDQGIIANETLAYFIARIYLFMVKIGVNPQRLRFRQHMGNEMAHYATDCWDAECLTSYGWVECVGCADRSCFDLTQHSKATNVRLVAEKDLAEPKLVQVVEIVPNKGLIGKSFKGEAQQILSKLNAIESEEAQKFEKSLTENGQFEIEINGIKIAITKEMVSVKKYEKKLHVEEFAPGVIEPSFGIGRIMHTVFEHNFTIRDGDDQRTYFALPAILCPIKCSILPLSNKPSFKTLLAQIAELFQENGIAYKIDDGSGSIGKRYARTDEISIPYAMTIDFESEKDNSVTLRERDSMEQVRIKIPDIPDLIRNLTQSKISWSEVKAKYNLVEQPSK